MASSPAEQNPMDEHTRMWANDPDWLGKEFKRDEFRREPLDVPGLSRLTRFRFWWNRMVRGD